MEKLKMSDNKIDLIHNLSRDISLENYTEYSELLVNLLHIDNNDRKYTFSWRGKSDQIKLAQKTSIYTLLPEFEKSRNWEQSNNIYIEGDNLESMKVILKTYYNKVDVIYIDPPYNTGKDFLYNDSFEINKKEYLEMTGQNFKSNPDTSGKYHTNWLNMMYPRLMTALYLMSNNSIIMVSIDENEVSNLTKIMDEIFGEKNRLNTIIWNKRNAQNDAKYIQKNHEYILVYKKGNPIIGEKISKRIKLNYDDLGYYYLGSGITTGGEGGTLKRRPKLGYTIYYHPETEDFFAYKDYEEKLISKSSKESVIYKTREKFLSKGYLPIRPPKKGGELGCWTWSQEKFNNEKHLINICKTKNNTYSIKKKYYINQSEIIIEDGEYYYLKDSLRPVKSIIDISSGLGSKHLNSLLGHKVFENSKPVELIQTLISYFQNKDALILDFFSGSATTAEAILNLNKEDDGNRKFILMQVNEPIDIQSEAYQKGYKNITELASKRIELIDKENFGFKKFKLSSSNLKEWDSSLEVSKDTLFNHLEVIKEDRTKEDVLYEILLKYGVFDQKVKTMNVEGRNIYDISNGYMLVDLNDSVKENDIKEIVKLKPQVVVFLESAFANDNDKINAEYTLKRNGVKDIKCI